MVKFAELFIVCALALPLDSRNEYIRFKEYVEKHFPGQEIVFIHNDETLIRPLAERTPFTYKGLRVWSISAVVPPVGDWHMAREIGHWILTHKTEIGLKWLALSFFGAALWMLIMKIAGHKRDDD